MDTLSNSRIKKMSPQLLVADLERSVEFYTANLGFELAFRYEDFYAGIIKDGCSIHLKTKPSIEKREGKKNDEDPDIVFSVDGINDLYKELSNKSVRLTQPLRDMPYGKEFYITDPDGHILAFMEEAML